MTKPSLLVTSPLLALAPDLFSAEYEVYDLRGATPEAWDILFTGPGRTIEVIVTGGDRLTREIMERLPRLRLVACITTGYDNIDYAWIKANGVALTTAAGQNTHDVADHAVALLFGARHRLLDAHRIVSAGGWRDQIPLRKSLKGAKAGIVGLGRIGRAVTERLAAHEMEIRWWGPREKTDAVYRRAPTLLDLACWADVLIVTGRSSADNVHLIDGSILKALGPQGIVVNVSRGSLVDEAALIALLRSGAVGGAGLDVFENEPPVADIWREVPNVLLTPHIAGATREAVHAMLWQAKENVRRHFSGETLISPVDDAL